jgi:imidazolonepropionase-like amidohydrolase
MAEVANDAGMPFAGHIPEEVGLETAIRMGQQTIEHMAGYIRFMDAETEPVSDEQLSRAVALTVENDVGVVPTQALWKTLIGAADTEQLLSYSELNYMPPAVVQNWKNFLDEGVKNTPFYSGEFASVHAENRQKLLKALQEGGARILFGTDAPQIFSVPGFSVRHELTIMEEAGLTPYEILTTATRAVGRHFEEKDRFGTVTEGSRADLLMVSENPLETPDTITQHRGVMIRGLWLPRQQIDEKLSEIEEYYH